jgi:hypothetical protein
MCGLVVILLVLGGVFGIGSFIPAAEIAIEPPVATVEAVATIDMPQLISCKGQSFEQDVAEIEAIVGDTFAGDDWNESISGNEFRTYATWTNASRGGLAFLDYQFYDCGVTQAQIAAYFSEDNFDILLSNYQSFERTASCESAGKTLYEFDVVTVEGIDYKLRWWYWQETPTRVAAMQLTFPVTDQASLAQYAGALFPNFPSCTPAAG